MTVDVSGIRALAFDYYGTIGDKQGLATVIDRHFPGRGAALAKLWFATCQRYCFQNGMMRRYMPWNQLTRSALAFAAADLGLELSADARDELIAADAAVPIYPEASDALARLAGCCRLYVLSMGAPAMIEASQTEAGIAEHFSGVITTQTAEVYKPAADAYALGEREIGLDRRAIGFVSGNSFDVIGARHYGYPTFWVRRYNQPLDPLGIEPDLIVADLTKLADAMGA